MHQDKKNVLNHGIMRRNSSRRKARRRARIADIAAKAEVGTATVDRVLNERGGVSEGAKQKVREAMAALEGQGRPASARDVGGRTKIRLVLPANAGQSTELLAREFLRIGTASNLEVGSVFVEKMNPAALAEKLSLRSGRERESIAFQALDHPLVRDAAERVLKQEVPMVCMMSGIDGLKPQQYVGTDNRAAGRTAGFLMGRMSRGVGKIAVVWGGALYRSHEDREIGFRAAIREGFPSFEIIDLNAGRDNDGGNYAQIASLLRKENDLVGIYSVGGGNEGIVSALVKFGVDDKVVLIGHNLTPLTRKYLIDGVMDAVIHQDMRTAARMAVASLVAQHRGNTINLRRLPIEIVTKENADGRI